MLPKHIKSQRYQKIPNKFSMEKKTNISVKQNQQKNNMEDYNILII